MEKCFLMKSNFRRAYLSNGLEFLSEIKSGVLGDENSILLTHSRDFPAIVVKTVMR
jgi:hypothetical protein